MDTTLKILISGAISFLILLLVANGLVALENLSHKIRKMTEEEFNRWCIMRIAEGITAVIMLTIYAGTTVIVYYLLFGRHA